MNPFSRLIQRKVSKISGVATTCTGHDQSSWSKAVIGTAQDCGKSNTEFGKVTVEIRYAGGMKLSAKLQLTRESR
jgi:hypothetical protein